VINLLFYIKNLKSPLNYRKNNCSNHYNYKCKYNQQQKNYKTEENWNFTEAYLNYLGSFEKKCKEELKNYKGTYFTFHLANSDELLSFEEMLEYLKENKIPNKQFYYDTDHRFGTVVEMLENIKSELV
jgi:hypothetical protein